MTPACRRTQEKGKNAGGSRVQLGLGLLRDVARFFWVEENTEVAFISHFSKPEFECRISTCVRVRACTGSCTDVVNG